VVSADSRQVYRGFDIGTAKPDAETLQQIPHHLIDISDGTESFDVGRFLSACDRLVPEIQERGAVAIISGGTAFYLQAYLLGLPDTPPSDATVRADLEDELGRDGLPALRAQLRAVDAFTEQRISANDGYRVLRALEVYRLAGRPLSSYPVPQTLRPGIKPLVVGLHREREELYRRINLRVAAMMTDGLPEEVAHLLASGYAGEEPGFRSIGYREFLTEAGKPPWSREQLDTVATEIARNSRRYAKRQELFFRRLPLVHWVAADRTEEVVQKIRNWLQAVSKDP
jgi:tRNA dimethylallyltransferase